MQIADLYVFNHPPAFTRARHKAAYVSIISGRIGIRRCGIARHHRNRNVNAAIIQFGCDRHRRNRHELYRVPLARPCGIIGQDALGKHLSKLNFKPFSLISHAWHIRAHAHAQHTVVMHRGNLRARHQGRFRAENAHKQEQKKQCAHPNQDLPGALAFFAFEC